FGELGLGQRGLAEIGAGKTGACQIDTGEIGTGKIDAMQIQAASARQAIQPCGMGSDVALKLSRIHLVLRIADESPKIRKRDALKNLAKSLIVAGGYAAGTAFTGRLVQLSLYAGK